MSGVLVGSPCECRVRIPPGIFVIWDGTGLVAKRIEHAPHSEPPRMVLKSLNPGYDSQ